MECGYDNFCGQSKILNGGLCPLCLSNFYRHVSACHLPSAHHFVSLRHIPLATAQSMKDCSGDNTADSAGFPG